MINEGTLAACRAALVMFALVFLVCILRNCSLAGACLRGAAVSMGTFLSVKLIYHLFFNALVNELSEYLRKDNHPKR